MDAQKSYDVVLLGSSLGIGAILRELYARKIRKILLITNTDGFSGTMPYGEVVMWRELLPNLEIFSGEIAGHDAEKKIISIREKVHHLKINSEEPDPAVRRVAYKFLVLDELPSESYFLRAKPKFLSNTGMVKHFFGEVHSRMPKSPKNEGVTFCVVGDVAGSGRLFFDLREHVLGIAEESGHPLKNITFIFIGDKKFSSEKVFTKKVSGSSPIHYIVEKDIVHISEEEVETKKGTYNIDTLLALGSNPVAQTDDERDVYVEMGKLETTYCVPRIQNVLEGFRKANIIAEQVERKLWDLPEKKISKSEVWSFMDTGKYSGVLTYRGKRISGVLGLGLYRILLAVSFFIYFSPKIARKLNRSIEEA